MLEAEAPADVAEGVAPEEVLAEWAAEEARSEANPGEHEILRARFPRLRGKQPPTEGWQGLPVSPAVQRRLEEIAAAEPEDAEASSAESMAIEKQEDADPTEIEEAAMKRPARKGDKLCPGISAEQPCRFTQEQARLGSAVRLQGKERCRFCDTEGMEAAKDEPHSKRLITRAMRTWAAAGRDDIGDAAMALLPQELQEHAKKALARPSRATDAAAARRVEEAAALKKALTDALAHRQSLAARLQKGSGSTTGEKSVTTNAAFAASSPFWLLPKKNKTAAGSPPWPVALKRGAGPTPGWSVRSATGWKRNLCGRRTSEASAQLHLPSRSAAIAAMAWVTPRWPPRISQQN